MAQWAAGDQLFETTVDNATSRGSQLANLQEDYMSDVWEAWMSGPENLPRMRFAKQRGTMSGKRKLGMVSIQRPKGVGFRVENVRQPFPFPSAMINPYILAKKQELRHQWTWEAKIAASSGDAAAF